MPVPQLNDGPRAPYANSPMAFGAGVGRGLQALGQGAGQATDTAINIVASMREQVYNRDLRLSSATADSLYRVKFGEAVENPDTVITDPESFARGIWDEVIQDEGVQRAVRRHGDRVLEDLGAAILPGAISMATTQMQKQEAYDAQAGLQNLFDTVFATEAVDLMSKAEGLGEGYQGAAEDFLTRVVQATVNQPTRSGNLLVEKKTNDLIENLAASANTPQQAQELMALGTIPAERRAAIMRRFERNTTARSKAWKNDFDNAVSVLKAGGRADPYIQGALAYANSSEDPSDKATLLAALEQGQVGPNAFAGVMDQFEGGDITKSYYDFVRQRYGPDGSFYDPQTRPEDRTALYQAAKNAFPFREDGTLKPGADVSEYILDNDTEVQRLYAQAMAFQGDPRDPVAMGEARNLVNQYLGAVTERIEAMDLDPMVYNPGRSYAGKLLSKITEEELTPMQRWTQLVQNSVLGQELFIQGLRDEVQVRAQKNASEPIDGALVLSSLVLDGSPNPMDGVPGVSMPDFFSAQDANVTALTETKLKERFESGWRDVANNPVAEQWLDALEGSIPFLDKSVRTEVQGALRNYRNFLVTQRNIPLSEATRKVEQFAMNIGMPVSLNGDRMDTLLPTGYFKERGFLQMLAGTNSEGFTSEYEVSKQLRALLDAQLNLYGTRNETWPDLMPGMTPIPGMVPGASVLAPVGANEFGGLFTQVGADIELLMHRLRRPWIWQTDRRGLDPETGQRIVPPLENFGELSIAGEYFAKEPGKLNAAKAELWFSDPDHRQWRLSSDMKHFVLYARVMPPPAEDGTFITSVNTGAWNPVTWGTGDAARPVRVPIEPLFQQNGLYKEKRHMALDMAPTPNQAFGKTLHPQPGAMLLP